MWKYALKQNTMGAELNVSRGPFAMVPKVDRHSECVPKRASSGPSSQYFRQPVLGDRRVRYHANARIIVVSHCQSSASIAPVPTTRVSRPRRSRSSRCASQVPALTT